MQMTPRFNFLCHNNDKTEVMFIGSLLPARKAGSLTLCLDGSIQTKLQRLANMFDSNLTCVPHGHNTIKT